MSVDNKLFGSDRILNLIDELGNSTIEYALLAAIISLVSIGSIGYYGYPFSSTAMAIKYAGCHFDAGSGSYNCDDDDDGDDGDGPPD